MKNYKKILGLMIVMGSLVAFSVQAGDKVGNGGGGVKVNGVYKTFYSAGVYINPTPEKSIPGQKLYTETILGLSGTEMSKSVLISSALPMGERKFYKILPEKMSTEVMDRLLEEYVRVIKQRSKDDLTIFAITDIYAKTTYLLPSFYSLSEAEQAAIIFHEAYWIMKPEADYAEVIAAEQSFQKFIENKEAGRFDLELPRLIGELLKDPSLPLISAFVADAKLQTVPSLIKQDQTMNARDIILDDSICNKISYSSSDSILRKRASYCKFKMENLEKTVLLTKMYPNSYFLEQLLNYLTESAKYGRYLEIRNDDPGFGRFSLPEMEYSIRPSLIKLVGREYIEIRIN